MDWGPIADAILAEPIVVRDQRSNDSHVDAYQQFWRSLAVRQDRWSSGCRDVSGRKGSYGTTSGDTFWLGLRGYDAPYPFPHGCPCPDDYEERANAIRAEQVRKAKEWNRRHAADVLLRESKLISAELFNESVQSVLADPDILNMILETFITWPTLTPNQQPNPEQPNPSTRR